MKMTNGRLSSEGLALVLGTSLGTGPTQERRKPRAGRLRFSVPPGATPVLPNPDNLHRNDPCPCGSGKKFKKCCIGKPVVVRGANRPVCVDPAVANTPRTPTE